MIVWKSFLLPLAKEACILLQKGGWRYINESEIPKGIGANINVQLCTIDIKAAMQYNYSHRAPNNGNSIQWKYRWCCTVEYTLEGREPFISAVCLDICTHMNIKRLYVLEHTLPNNTYSPRYQKTCKLKMKHHSTKPPSPSLPHPNSGGTSIESPRWPSSFAGGFTTHVYVRYLWEDPWVWLGWAGGEGHG